jgi:hypothetical protein
MPEHSKNMIFKDIYGKILPLEVTDRPIRILDGKGHELFRSRILTATDHCRGTYIVAEDPFPEDIHHGMAELTIDGFDEPMTIPFRLFTAGEHFNALMD